MSANRTKPRNSASSLSKREKMLQPSKDVRFRCAALYLTFPPGLDGGTTGVQCQLAFPSRSINRRAPIAPLARREARRSRIRGNHLGGPAASGSSDRPFFLAPPSHRDHLDLATPLPACARFLPLPTPGRAPRSSTSACACFQLPYRAAAPATCSHLDHVEDGFQVRQAVAALHRKVRGNGAY